jgi:hypothetical protein
MVPHMRRGTDPGAARRITRAVTSPDDTRGERLVAFYRPPSRPLSSERLCRTELPRLWLPKRDDLRFVEQIPTLGTGVDSLAVRKLAAGGTRRWRMDEVSHSSPPRSVILAGPIS